MQTDFWGGGGGVYYLHYLLNLNIILQPTNISENCWMIGKL